MSEISPLDHIIHLAGGATTSTEKYRSQLQQAKQARQNNLMKQNLDLLRENGRLRKEIAYHEGRIKPLLLFYQKCLDMQQKWQSDAQDVVNQMTGYDNELLENLGVDVANVQNMEKF